MKLQSCLLALALAAPVVTLADDAKFTIPFGCSEEPFACILITGPYERAVSSVNEKTFTVTGSEHTCCQLASKIQIAICEAGEESKNAVVECE